jgi:hypothetical protein
MKQMKQNLVPKVPTKFNCDKCDYKTSRKSQFERHLTTPKHTNETNETPKVPNGFKCYCGNDYNSRTTLWRHMKKELCGEKNTFKNDTEPKITEMFMEMCKQNKEFKELLVEQNKQIIEMSSKPTTNNSHNNNNNSFNLQFFLNETCKDALNISDFVSQLQVGIKDLEETGRLGYAEGISKIFINGLKQLDVNQRPVHCSDVKRETMYIKDENIWEKEDVKHLKLTNAIRDVAHKNIQQIQVWTDKHPEHKDLSSKYNDKYMKLVSEAMPGSTREESDKNYKKIATNIMKQSLIEKFIEIN